MKQWFLKITDYADELLQDIDYLDSCQQMLKQCRKTGLANPKACFHFDIKGLDEKIKAFSTTPEAIFGATFIAIAYNHPCLKKLQ